MEVQRAPGMYPVHKSVSVWTDCVTATVNILNITTGYNNEQKLDQFSLSFHLVCIIQGS